MPNFEERMRIHSRLMVMSALSLVSCQRSATSDFAEVALTAPVSTRESADPGLALDPSNGDVLLSWVGGDSTGWSLYFARSGDEGATWSAPVIVAEGINEVHPHGESSPRLVAASGGRVAIAWTNSVTVPGRKWPATGIRLSRSTDGGISWSAPITLNDDTTQAPAGHQFHGAAWSGDSGLIVSWLDERKGAALEIHHGEHSPTAGDITEEPDAVIYSALSNDFGQSWASSNRLLWGEVCPCCRVSLARSPDGRVISAWRKHYPGNIRDVVTAQVGDGAPADPMRVNQDNWVYPGCPHTGPGISIGSDGATHVVWYVGKEGDAGVYYQRVRAGSADRPAPLALVRARTLPAAHTTVAALSGGEALAVYDMTETGDRQIGVSLVRANRTVAAQRQLSGSNGGSHPQVLAIEPGKALIAWTGMAGNHQQLRLAGITFESEAGASVALKE
jgi:hypothetical protein